LAQQKQLAARKNVLSTAYRKELSDDSSKLSMSVSSGTSDEGAIKDRFSEVRRLIRETLEE